MGGLKCAGEQRTNTVLSCLVMSDALARLSFAQLGNFLLWHEAILELKWVGRGGGG